MSFADSLQRASSSGRMRAAASFRESERRQHAAAVAKAKIRQARGGKAFDVDAWRTYKGLPEGRERKRLETELLEANLGLVHLAIKRLRNSSRVAAELDPADYLTGGMIGLGRALENFNPEKGSFSTIAMIWIRKYLLDQLEKEELVRHPGRYRMTRAVAKVIEVYQTRFNRAPTLEEVKAELPEAARTLTAAQFREMTGHTWYHDSLDSTFVGDGACGGVGGGMSEGTATPLIDTVPSDTCTAEEALIEDIEMRIMDRAIDLLTEEEKKVIGKVVCEGRPLDKVGKEMKRSAQSIMRIRNEALAKMRKHFQEEE